MTTTVPTTTAPRTDAEKALADWEASASLVTYSQTQRLIAADSHRATLRPGHGATTAPTVVYGDKF